MSRSFSKFLKETNGNFAMIMGIAMLPVAVVVGLGVDYSRSSTTRSNMQNSLDAAALAAMAEAGTPSLDKRKKRLETVYSANGGKGNAQIVGDLEQVGDQVVLTARADGELPTTFMNIVGVKETKISVSTKVGSPMRLQEIEFKFKRASGWWDKEVSLMGRKDGSNTFKKLVGIHYQWNGKQGTTTNNVGHTEVARFV